jgi:sugar O-acyltransferase (sialic acid O-acetyltransferase NeuD family)
MIVIVGGNAGAKIATEIFAQIYPELEIKYVETYWKIKQEEQLFFKFEDSVEYLKQPFVSYFVATGDNSMREKITSYIIEHTRKSPINCIHPTVTISPSAKIGYGNLICPGAVIHVDAQVKNGTIINTNSIVEHDCLIEDYAQVSPGTTLCGYVKVRKRSFISANSTLIPHIEVGEDSIVAAGAVVIENVPNRVMVAGVPSKIKKHEI